MLYCVAGPVLCELSESERRRALKEAGESWGVGPAANVLSDQRRKQTERRDHSNEEKRQNRQRIPTAGMTVRNQQAHQSDSDCECRNQEPSLPLPILNHL